MDISRVRPFYAKHKWALVPSMRAVLVLLFCMISPAVFADGWTFAHGHFPEGKTTVFTLTKPQKALLDIIRRCQTNNKLTPFVFHLSARQASALKQEVGFSPKRFAVFESFRGDNGVDIEVNVINRFSENEFEVPHKLLMPDEEARKWERNTIGWLPNPIEHVNPSNVKEGSCPK